MGTGKWEGKGGIQGLRAFRRYGKRQEAGRETGPSQDGAGGFAGRDRGRAGEPGVLERGSQEGWQGRLTLCRVGGDSTVRGRNCSRPPPIPFAMSCTRASRQKNAEGWASCSCPVSETKIHVSFVLCLEIPPPKTSLEIGHDRQQVLEQPRELIWRTPAGEHPQAGFCSFSSNRQGPIAGPAACLPPRRPRFSAKSGPRSSPSSKGGKRTLASVWEGSRVPRKCRAQRRSRPPCPVVALHPTWSLAETETSSTPRNQPTARSHSCIEASGLPLGASAVGSSRPMRRWRRSDQERLAGCCHLLTSRNCGASDPNAPPLCRPLSP